MEILTRDVWCRRRNSNNTYITLGEEVNRYDASLSQPPSSALMLPP